MITRATGKTLREVLAERTREGTLYRSIGGGAVECFSCGHRCVVKNGRDGICRVRFNRDGRLYVPWGYCGSVALDPVEKKPFFHALPGSLAMSFGMLGCDLHCGYCQNWITSQTLRDPDSVADPEIISPEDVVLLAVKHDAKIVTSTYNEPLITSEWAVEIFRIAKRYGLRTAYVSNGNGTPEVIDYLKPWVDFFKVDLKGFNDRQYRKLGGVLKNVLDTIKLLVDRKFWVEVVTLLVPGFNDSEDEIRQLAKFLVSVSPDIPWHVTAFHSDYKMTDTGNTPASTLFRAATIGREEGIRFVYAGNIAGQAGEYENTHCPSCGKTLISRTGFLVRKNIIREGRCPDCGTTVPGVWS